MYIDLQKLSVFVKVSPANSHEAYPEVFLIYNLPRKESIENDLV